MDNFDNLKVLINPDIAKLELLPTIYSFLICILMSFILREFYVRRSFSLTGKNHIGSIIPILSSVVFLVIIVVKSSLALSLGLVGALSIVRFRTPIKEPEELVYLFLAIAIGLGYAAGHILITTLIVLSIMLIIYFWLSNRQNSNTNEYNLVIKWGKDDVLFEDVEREILSITDSLKLIRFDNSSQGNTLVMLINPNKETSIDQISSKLKLLDKDMEFTFFEAKTNW
tara:strand:- start:1600 stop:2280 length:681 start_codon:yes stop_codon:yes gene_type:complete